MKIIGTTENGFLVEAKKTELEKLADLYYNKSAFDIGSTVQIDEMYDQLKFLKEHKNTIAQAQEKLKKVIDNLEMVKPFVES